MIRLFRRLLLTHQGIMVLITLNAVVIFLLSFPSLAQNRWLLWLDQLFLSLFVVEAIWKLRLYGPQRYFQSGWNTFDFVIVCISLPSLLMVMKPSHDLSFLIALRLLRFFRMLRVLRFVPDIQIIITGLVRALRASLMVLLVMMLGNFLLSIFSAHLFAELDPEHFGNPLRAFFSMFQVMTLEGWVDVTDGVANEVGGSAGPYLVRFFFLVLVLAGGIFGLSLANAIFVDEMTLDNNRLLEDKIDRLQQQLAELKRMMENQNVDGR